MPEILDLVDRAARDPRFLQRLQSDPYGTARAEGVEVSDAELRELLGMENATDAELAEALQSRLSYSDKGLSGWSHDGPPQAGTMDTNITN